jgi:hypothetical protein
MKKSLAVFSIGAALAFAVSSAQGQNLLANGNLDRVEPVEIVPGFFLPKPSSWENIGFRAVSGPYEDELSSEPWAGPAPTPVTNDGLLNDPPFNTNPDWGVFFKAFTGNQADGAATGHLQQSVPGTPGVRYTLTGWAGAEPNFLAGDAVFALEFLAADGTTVLGGSVLSLLPTLYIDNGEPFDYKMYTLTGTSPAGTAFVRARASMIDGVPNPAGGGQAFVVDDFRLVPEPSMAISMLLIGAAALAGRRR